MDRIHYIRALAGFADVVTEVAEDSVWDAPSPCESWTTRDVIGHVIAVQYAIIATIEGRRAPMNPMVDPGRHAGVHPGATWAQAMADAVAAVADDGVLDSLVGTWRGETTVSGMLGYNVGDLTVHTWDLARAVGGDDRLDDELVRVSLELYAPIADTMRDPGVFAEAIAVDQAADLQTRLLALVGRAA